MKQLKVGLLILYFIFIQGFSSEVKELFKNDILIFSNYPESVRQPGLMFEKTINNKSFRIFYHHRNISKDPLSIVVMLSNPTEEKQIIHLRKGLGGSCEDIIFAGHKAMSDFLCNINNKAEKISLDSLSSTSIVIHKIKSNQTSSGILHVTNESEGPLNIKMTMIDISYPSISGFMDVPDIIDQFRVAEFEDVFKSYDVNYNVVDQIKTIKIGGQPYVKDSYYNYTLKGNYGVAYAVSVNLENSLNTSKSISFFLSPAKDNSVDRGVIIVDGEIKDIELLTFKNDLMTMKRFYEIKLKPQEKKQIDLFTMPQAGCFYPINIILKTKEV